VVSPAAVLPSTAYQSRLGSTRRGSRSNTLRGAHPGRSLPSTPEGGRRRERKKPHIRTPRRWSSAQPQGGEGEVCAGGRRGAGDCWYVGPMGRLPASPAAVEAVAKRPAHAKLRTWRSHCERSHRDLPAASPACPVGQRRWRPHSVTLVSRKRQSAPGGLPQETGERQSAPGGLPQEAGERISAPGGLPQEAGGRISAPGGLPQEAGERISAPRGLPQEAGGRISAPGGLPQEAGGRRFFASSPDLY
jgi:hypothetical protein